MASRCVGCSACKAKGCDLNRAGACICCRPPCIRATEDTYLTTDGNASGSESERLHHHNTLSVIENSYSGPSETDSRTQFAETAEHLAESLVPLKRDHIPEGNVIASLNSLGNASTVIDGAISTPTRLGRTVAFAFDENSPVGSTESINPLKTRPKEAILFLDPIVD